MQDEKSKKFELLYHAHSRNIYSYILRMVRHEDESLDLLQDTFANFVRFFQDRPLPADDTSCRMYLFKIARNLIINAGKSSYHRNVLVTDSLDDHPPESRGETPEESYIKKVKESEAHRIIDEVLTETEEEARTAFLLRYSHNLKLEEIASLIGRPLSTTSRIINRVKKRMEKEAELKGIRFDSD